MTRVALFELGGDKGPLGPAHDLRAEAAAQLFDQRRVAGQAPRFQQGGADDDVLARLPEALVDAARGLAHLQPEVPQGVEHELDHALGVGGGLPGPQEQEVDVREGRHDAAAVAADREQGEALALGRVLRRIDEARRERPERSDDGVGDRGERVGGLEPPRAGPQPRLRRLPPGRQFGAQPFDQLWARPGGIAIAAGEEGVEVEALGRSGSRKRGHRPKVGRLAADVVKRSSRPLLGPRAVPVRIAEMNSSSSRRRRRIRRPRPGGGRLR